MKKQEKIIHLKIYLIKGTAIPNLHERKKIMGKAKKTIVYDYIEQEKVLNKPWISSEDLKIILPLGINAINRFRRSITDEMDANGEFYFKTKPILIPTKKVIEKLDIDVGLIRKEASRMRKGLM